MLQKEYKMNLKRKKCFNHLKKVKYQEKGKKIQILQQGDVVKIKPEVIHWHGASDTESFAHISIETNIPNNTAIWYENVTDEEYQKEN